MKLTNLQIINMLNCLDKYKSYKLPQKITYTMYKNNVLLQNEYKIYEMALQKLITDYSEHVVKDDEGQVVIDKILNLPKVKDEVHNEFITKLNDLLTLTIDIELCKMNSENFDYDNKNDNYDVLTNEDMINLQSILCDVK